MWQMPPPPRGRKWLKFSQRSAFLDGKFAAYGQATHLRVIKGSMVIAIGVLGDSAEPEKEVFQKMGSHGCPIRLDGVQWILVPLKPQWDL